MYSLLNRSPLRAPAVLSRGVRVPKGFHVRAGDVARSRNVPRDRQGRPIHQGFWFSTKRRTHSAYAKRYQRPVSVNNKKDIHFMTFLAEKEMIMKEGTLMHSHFEPLDHRNLTPKYPMAMSGMGAGHTTNLGLSLQNQRELESMGNMVMKRNEIEELKQWIRKADHSRPATRYLVHGPHLAGKSIGANQLVQWGKRNGYFVVFSTAMNRWVQRTRPNEVILLRGDIKTEAYQTVKKMGGFKTRYEPLMDEGNYRRLLKDASTYDQNDQAGMWLQTLKLLNGKALKQLKSTKPFQLSMDRSEDIPPGVTLANILEEGHTRFQLRCDTMKFLIDEIKTQSEEMAANGMPVLVVTDQANFMTQGCYVTIIRSPEQIPYTDWGIGHGQTGRNGYKDLVKYDDVVTDSRRLNGLRYLLDLHKNDWKGASIVGFTTNNQMPRKKWNAKLGKHNDRSIIQHENDLFEMLGDQGFMDLWHPFIPIELKNMDEHQKALMGQFLYHKKVLYGRSESLMAQQLIEKMSDDVLGRYVRNQFKSF